MKKATLFRMVLPDHECPFGRSAKNMLEESGYEVDDRQLKTRAEVDAFKDKMGVATTPYIMIDGRELPGSEELAAYLEEVESVGKE